MHLYGHSSPRDEVGWLKHKRRHTTACLESSSIILWDYNTSNNKNTLLRILEDRKRPQQFPLMLNLTKLFSPYWATATMPLTISINGIKTLQTQLFFSSSTRLNSPILSERRKLSILLTSDSLAKFSSWFLSKFSGRLYLGSVAKDE